MTAIVESFQISSGDSVANNEARFVAALDLLKPDANDHVFFVEKNGLVMIGKYPV
jgi:hypothetical protein